VKWLGVAQRPTKTLLTLGTRLYDDHVNKEHSHIELHKLEPHLLCIYAIHNVLVLAVFIVLWELARCIQRDI
jgi:hypothetical protein